MKSVYCKPNQFDGYNENDSYGKIQNHKKFWKKTVIKLKVKNENKN